MHQEIIREYVKKFADDRLVDITQFSTDVADACGDAFDASDLDSLQQTVSRLQRTVECEVRSYFAAVELYKAMRDGIARVTTATDDVRNTPDLRWVSVVYPTGESERTADFAIDTATNAVSKVYWG